MRRFALTALAALSLLTLAAGPRPLVAQVNPAVTISVDAALNRHAIDPRIYGVAFANAAAIADLSLPLNRWGGNTTSRYNWANSTANHARDYFFENVPDDVPQGHDGSNGESADLFMQPTIANGAQPVMTIPMLGYLPSTRGYACGYAIDKYTAFGCCLNNDWQYRPNCGDGFNVNSPNPNNPIPLKHINDPLDISTLYTSAHQGNWVQHIVDTFGAGRYYSLDNEPGLWDSTHFDVHPDPSTYDDIRGRMLDYGAVIKAHDPSAIVTGPEEWGWLGYFDSTADWNGNPATTADRDAHGSVPLIEWLLQQSRSYEQTNGVRLLDIATVHYYPQGDKSNHNEYNESNPAEEVLPATKLLRNQSTRSLWDPNYIDQSWISDLEVGGVKVRLIPRMREWVNANYPGTQIGITEYNWGAEHDINGATAQADILGIFGREGLDMAARWTTPQAGSHVYNSFKMFRNYDGLHSKFGDVSVSASVPNADELSSFAALRTSDHALTVMIVSKTLSGSTPVTVNVANFAPSANAHVYQLTDTNTITDLGTLAWPYNITVASPSITLLVIPGSYLSAPTGVVATATSITNVSINWDTVPGLTYQVQRATSIAGPWTATTQNDGGRAADTTYLYRVIASNGSISSGPSAIDPATTVLFTDDNLTTGMLIKKEHINELRTAVNAMRAAGGLGAQAFADSPLISGTVIKAVHLLQLRTALDQARATLGLSSGTWLNPAPANVNVKAAHIIALRNGVK